MWKNHVIICIVMVAIAVPIAIVDLTQKPASGGWILLDLRGILIVPYLIFLAVHLIVSTTWVKLLTPSGLLLAHVISGLISIALIITVTAIIFNYQDRKDARVWEERQEELAVLRKIITLRSWEYIPDSEEPDSIRIVVKITESGRFAGGVKGWAAGEYGELVFYSQDVPQRMVKAGEEYIETYPLEKESELKAESISIRLSLFKDETGTAPEDISIIYETEPGTDYDGHFLYEKLPMPVKN